MGISFNASVSGISTSMTRHDITANNVANINTPGYEARTAHQTEMASGGVRISSITKTPNSSGGNSNTDLVEETKEQIVNKDTLAANATAFKVKDRMVGELLDLIA